MTVHVDSSTMSITVLTAHAPIAGAKVCERKNFWESGRDALQKIRSGSSGVLCTACHGTVNKMGRECNVDDTLLEGVSPTGREPMDSIVLRDMALTTTLTDGCTLT